MSQLLLVVAPALAAGAGVGLLLGRRVRPVATPVASSAEAEALGLKREADTERERVLRDAEIGAREAALVARAEAETKRREMEERLGRGALALVEREVDQEARKRELQEGRTRLGERMVPLETAEAETASVRKEIGRVLAEVRGNLERVAGERLADIKQRLREAEIDAAQASAADLVRRSGEGSADPEHVRSARRVMGIAVGRFSGHYLIERHPGSIPLPPPQNGKPALGEDELRAIEEVTHIKLTPNETGDMGRLEGLDGVGREVVRRTVQRLFKRPANGVEAVTRIVREFASELDREVATLGRKAFQVLGIPRAHPEIVKLVGRLNWRTSYTQNQWKHAVEAAFLCGMIAEEMGMDVQQARRAALIHDIGKSLTHEMDGSHAVIGADYARRLGEAEIVANAIGAHHTDEPFNSPLAYLVAASDAMSGARPGARRQSEDNHLAKIGDLERLSRAFPGVSEAFAVQGGREVRIHVHEDRVDDLMAVRLSNQIAEKISAEMTFPGQIRVTVIREVRAVEVAS